MDKPVFIAGPCVIESAELLDTVAQELVRMHRRWIDLHWGEGYDPEQYFALVEGYLADPRFVSYYDSAAGEGATEFLVKAVRASRG